MVQYLLCDGSENLKQKIAESPLPLLKGSGTEEPGAEYLKISPLLS